MRCQNVDGGFGTRPGSESHAGQIYCCLGLLSIAGVYWINLYSASHNILFEFPFVIFYISYFFFRILYQFSVFSCIPQLFFGKKNSLRIVLQFSALSLHSLFQNKNFSQWYTQIQVLLCKNNAIEKRKTLYQANCIRWMGTCWDGGSVNASCPLVVSMGGQRNCLTCVTPGGCWHPLACWAASTGSMLLRCASSSWPHRYSDPQTHTHIHRVMLMVVV